MSTLILTDICELLTLCGHGPPEEALGVCHNARVVIVNGVVLYAGEREEGPRPYELPGPVTIKSAGGRLVTPGLLDAHTHPIWAGDRSREFDLRNQGRSYADLQEHGGGIHFTVEKTRAASDRELINATRRNLSRMLSHGTTRCEGKTGYGLTPAEELRLLRLLIEAGRGHPVSLSPTLLFHVPPRDLRVEERPRFIEELTGILPAARELGAQAVDVYCDEGAFTLAETGILLAAAAREGLMLRCHAEQFTHTGAARLAAELSAVSVEHLEEIDEAGIAALARSGTVANLLPGAALTLRLRYPDARRMIDAGIAVALGTDSNPGSSLCESLPLMMSLGCTQMGMSCAEAWLAVTRNAAQALGDPLLGKLGPGSRADLVLWDAEGHREVCQHLGAHLVHAVYTGGVMCSGPYLFREKYEAW